MRFVGICLVIVLLFLIGINLVMTGEGSREQPIEFSHQKHVGELELDCSECHRYYKDHETAGLPDIEVCLECHSEAVTESREEEKIRTYAEKGQGIPWERIYLMPDHVFFSHRRHVTLGKLGCSPCHGEMGKKTAPLTKPEVNLSMGFCTDCHRKMGANRDCLACHI
ncbi:MAG: cytochrome c3 family protein [bacterium]